LVGLTNFEIIKHIAVSYRELVSYPELQDSMTSWKGLTSIELIWSFKDGMYRALPALANGQLAFTGLVSLKIPEDTSRTDILKAVKGFRGSKLPELEDPEAAMTAFLAPVPDWRVFSSI
jgi:hypothetical protein